MNLSDAITAVETASTAYNNAVQTTKSDSDNIASIQSKLDAANAVVTQDKTAEDAAAKALNDGLDALIAAATAAKVGGSATAPASGSVVTTGSSTGSTAPISASFGASATEEPVLDVSHLTS